jgi:hypothetical protein
VTVVIATSDKDQRDNKSDPSDPPHRRAYCPRWDARAGVGASRLPGAVMRAERDQLRATRSRSRHSKELVAIGPPQGWV